MATKIGNGKGGFRMPTLLFVSDVAPDSTARGNQHRTARMMEAYLEIGFSVDFLLLNREDKKEHVAKRLQTKFPLVNFIISQHPRRQDASPARVFRFFTRLFDRTGQRKWKLRTIESAPFQFDRAFLTAIKKKPYNLVHVNYLRTTPYSLRRFSGIKFVDLHDVMSLRFERKIALKSEHKRQMAVSLHRRSELELLSQYDRAICITADDHEFFVLQGIDPKKVPVIPAFFQGQPIIEIKSESHDLLFVASDVGLNVEALHWFVREVFPLARSHLPALSLTIVGRVNSVESVKQLAKTCSEREHIRMLGYVDDIAHLYAQSKIVIAPMIFGTGMNIKVAEALSFGKAIVGTRSAFRGIKVKNQHSALIADKPQDFADAICQLMGNAEFHDSIAKNAMEVFLRDHTAEGAAMKLRSIVKDAFSSDEYKDQ